MPDGHEEEETLKRGEQMGSMRSSGTSKKPREDEVNSRRDLPRRTIGVGTAMREDGWPGRMMSQKKRPSSGK